MTVATTAAAAGVHESVPFAEYLAWDACSASRLRDMRRSALYCYQRIHDPQPPTPAMILGTACHYAILEPDKVESVYVTAGRCAATKRSDGERCRSTGSVYRAGRWWCGISGHAPPPDEEPGEERVVLKPDDHARVLSIRDAFHANAAAVALLERQARREVSVVWEDEATGLLCKARPDILAPDMVGDVKVTKDAHPDKIEAAIAHNGYHIQAALYLAGLRACGRRPKDFVVVAVEPKPPHETCAYALDPDALRCGEERVRRLKEKYRACVETGLWPGYPRMLGASVPYWEARACFPEEA